jgi:hypothetical protein
VYENAYQHMDALNVAGLGFSEIFCAIADTWGEEVAIDLMMPSDDEDDDLGIDGRYAD